MPGKIKQGQSIFIPFRNGMSISDSQNKTRMYMSKEKFKASFPAFRLGTEDIELLEYAPVRKGRWEWFEEWLPSTPDHPRECYDCGWCCSECKNALEDMVGGYWDNPDEKPELNFCPNCGADMRW